MKEHKFTKSSHNESAAEIVSMVMDRVQKYERRRYLIRLSIHTTLTVGAAIAFIPTISYLLSDVSASGFTSYLSLFIYDSAYVMNHLGDLILSIATTLPLMASILIIGLATIFIHSLQRIFRYKEIFQLDYNHQIS